MANIFSNLPVTGGNGSGAAVDTSGMGRERTITVQDAFRGTVAIEFSNESAGGPWAQIATFTQPGKKTIPFAGQFMRATRTGVPTINPGLPNVDVASNDDGGLYIDLPATAGDGTGASINVSALGTFNTVVVGDPFRGSVSIEISEDDIDFAECMVFNNPGNQSKEFTAQFMRVTRKNVPGVNPGLPDIDVGAINDPAGSASSELTPASFTPELAQSILDGDGCLRLGPGTFDLGSTSLTVNGVASIQGCGPGITFLTYSGAGEAIIFNSNSSATTLTVSKMFELVGPGAATAAKGFRIGRAMGSPLSAQSNFEDIRVRAFGVGIELGSAQNCTFTRVRADLNGINIQNRDDIRSTNCDFYSCIFRTALTRGIYLPRAENFHFYKCLLEANGEEGMFIENIDPALTTVQGVYLHGCFVEGNNTTRIGTGVAEIRVEAVGANTVRNVFLFDTHWSAVDPADFHLTIGNNEQVEHAYDNFSGDLQVNYATTGTPARIATPGRGPSRQWNKQTTSLSGSQPAGLVWARLFDVTDGSVSPRAFFGDIIIFNNTAPTSVPQFENFVMQDGEVVWAWFRDDLTTLVHSAVGGNKQLRLDGGVDYSPPANTIVAFVLEGGEFLEIWRSSTGSDGGVSTGNFGPTWNVTGPFIAEPVPAVKVGDLVQADPTAGAFAITLPTISGNTVPAISIGRTLVVKNTTGSVLAITVTAAGGDTIDGAATFVIATGFESITLVSDGVSNWSVI